MTAAQSRRWYEGYCREVEKSIARINAFNRNQIWITRPMTPEEYEEAFGSKTESCHRLKLNIKGEM